MIESVVRQSRLLGEQNSMRIMTRDGGHTRMPAA